MTSDQLQTTGEPDHAFDHEKARRGARLLIESMGVNPDEASFDETWQRRVPDAVEELSEGYREDQKPTMRTFAADGADEEFIVKSGIPINSLCEHHLLPYTGTATIGYRPDEEVLGLSKLTRYVRWQARRLTTQEQPTTDIATGLADEIGTETAVVLIRATHLCEAMRGIETNTETETIATVGDPAREDRQRMRDAIEPQYD